MLKSVVQPQRFFKMWASAVAVGLIAVMAVSSPVNAETFTLDELTRGPGFTIGEVRFTRWEVREASGDPSKITVDTIDDPNLPGFQLNGNGQLADGDAGLKYTFDVETTSEQPLILGGQLNLTSHTADEDGEISILLQEEDPEPDSLELEVFVNKDRDGDRTQDAMSLAEDASVLALQTTVTLDGRNAIVIVNSYTTQFAVRPAVDPPGDQTLTVIKEGDGSGTVLAPSVGINCGDTCSAEVEYPRVVSLVAAPDSGSEFSGWSGCGFQSANDTCVVIMTEPRTVTANFGQQTKTKFGFLPGGVYLPLLLD